MNAASYFDLGATLYTPCIHHKLSQVMQSGKTGARSLVFCLEDAVHESELEQALIQFKQALTRLQPDASVRRFVRPRNPQVLAQLLQEPQIGKLDGFVLPKLDLDNIEAYHQVITRWDDKGFVYMPTLETAQVFDMSCMRQLAERLITSQIAVICLRIGGNDLMNLMGIKRMPGMTIYDTPVRTVMDQLVMVFRPRGFELSAPVFDMLDDAETLTREIQQDIAYGFFAKTAVHPTQVPIIEQAFSHYLQETQEQARRVLNNNQAVFRLNGQMMEANCHKQWAQRTTQLLQRIN